MLFQAPPLQEIELEVIEQVTQLEKDLGYLFGRTPKRWYGLLRRNAFARAIRASNTIEGYNVTIDDALAAVEGEEPLEPRDEAMLALIGYRNAMTYVLQKADDPHFTHSQAMLQSLHFMMVGHDLSKHPGLWRPGHIFVRDESTGQRVYDGPPIEMVPGLIDELVSDLNSTEPRLPIVVKAAMGHLNLVMIHPFSDGNGRMARCLQTLVLARGGVVAPMFSSIEEDLGRNTRAHYDVLAEVGQGSWNPTRSARPWIRFCLAAHYRQAMTFKRRTKTMERLFDELELLAKAKGFPLRSVAALVDAAVGYRVRNSTYRKAVDVTYPIAGRDLRLLVGAGLLIPIGEKRGRHYVASPSIQELYQRVAEPKRPIPDPFKSPRAGDAGASSLRFS